MLICRMCGKPFDPDEVGHVDDHLEICESCFPKFHLKIALRQLGKHVAHLYRLKMCREHGEVII